MVEVPQQLWNPDGFGEETMRTMRVDVRDTDFITVRYGPKIEHPIVATSTQSADGKMQCYRTRRPLLNGTNPMYVCSYPNAISSLKKTVTRARDGFLPNEDVHGDLEIAMAKWEHAHGIPYPDRGNLARCKMLKMAENLPIIVVERQAKLRKIFVKAFAEDADAEDLDAAAAELDAVDAEAIGDAPKAEPSASSNGVSRSNNEVPDAD